MCKTAFKHFKKIFYRSFYQSPAKLISMMCFSIDHHISSNNIIIIYQHMPAFIYIYDGKYTM